MVTQELWLLLCSAVQWTNSYWLLGTTGTPPDETVVVARDREGGRLNGRNPPEDLLFVVTSCPLTPNTSHLPPLFARDDACLVSILSFPSLSHPHMNAGFDWSCPLYHCTTIITCRTK